MVGLVVHRASPGEHPRPGHIELVAQEQQHLGRYCLTDLIGSHGLAGQTKKGGKLPLCEARRDPHPEDPLAHGILFDMGCHHALLVPVFVKCLLRLCTMACAGDILAPALLQCMHPSVFEQPRPAQWTSQRLPHTASRNVAI